MITRTVRFDCSRPFGNYKIHFAKIVYSHHQILNTEWIFTVLKISLRVNKEAVRVVFGSLLTRSLH